MMRINYSPVSFRADQTVKQEDVQAPVEKSIVAQTKPDTLEMPVNEQKVSQHPTTWPKSPQTISQDKKVATRTDSAITPTKLTLLSRADLLARANNTLKTPAERKIVKQLTNSQKITYGSKPQNTTRTTYRATIKHL